MSERTETPTPRHRAELRQKGYVARSPELAPALGLLGLTAILSAYGATAVAELARFMSLTFRSRLTHRDWSIDAVHQSGLDVLWLFVRLVAPLVLTVLVVGLVANLSQTRFLVTLDPLMPDLRRLSSVSGTTQLFSRHRLLEAGRTIARLLLIGIVAYRVVGANLSLLVLTAEMEPGIAAVILSRTGWSMALWAAVVWVMFASLDYLYQRWQFERNIRMTRRELLEELHNVEGNPYIEGRRRQTQRRLTRQHTQSS